MEKIQTLSHQIKIAQTKFEVSELIRHRWSARSFSDKLFTEDITATILEAASWAPSSMNMQPWRYKVAFRNTGDSFQKMADCLTPGNKLWAQNAAVMMVSIAELQLTNGEANMYALYDTGAANQNLLLQAASMGILGHLMGGYDADMARRLFNIPDHQIPVVIIALGYPDAAEKLSEPFLTREITPRTRKDLTHITEFLY